MAKKYVYKGKFYSVADLARLKDLPEGILYRRLKDGWSVEEALETPVFGRCQCLDACWKGKDLVVVFVKPILEVFASMQPCLNKEYVARPFKGTNPSSKTRVYYIITLDNGKPLIVYPDEFQIIREAV